MSLINEALKRAQMEKARTKADDHRPIPLAPAVGEDIPRDRLRSIAVAAAAVLVVTAVLAWTVLRPMPVPADGAAELARAAAPLPPAAPAPTVELTTLQTLVGPRKLCPDAAAAYEKTALALRDYQAPAAPLQVLEADPEPAEAETVKVAEAKAPPPVEQVARVEEPPAQKPPPPPAQHAPPGNYKLNGIMHGPSGPVAVINGYPVHIGEAIDGAKVVRIDRYSVILDIGGNRLVVRM